MKAHQAAHSVTTMCRVLGVSASGYYAWVVRRPSPRATKDSEVLEQIRRFHQASRGTYGTPRLHRDLRAAGVRVGRKRVARLLKQAGLRGVSRRKWVRTTVRSAHGRPAPDLVQRQFAATAPNQLWVADITYIPTWAGMLYLAVVLDVWSRRVIGWAMESHLRTELVVAALNMAVEQRRPQDVIHHSDQGSQYTAVGFGLRCRAAGVRPSMGSVGDCYDNALCESFFATLECELLDRVTLRTPHEARLAVFDFIEGWYNSRRRHSALDYESPLTFERQHPTTARAGDGNGVDLHA
jgi:putative transposase